MAITDQLRKSIVESGETHYRIGKDAAIAPHILDRFVSGQRAHLRTDTVDKLCEYLGLELRPVRAPRKQTGKRTETSRKQKRKK